MGDFVMPSLGADMESGRIVEWRVGPGDAVRRGDVIAVVGTEKSDIDVEVFEDGIIDELLVEVGRDVPVGTPLATMRSGADGSAPPPPLAEEHPRVKASPRARRLAAERGIDLDDLQGSGPSGAVVGADLDRTPVAGSPPRPSTDPGARREAPSPGAADEAGTMRAAIGRLMARSAQEIPHYHLVSTIDLSTAESWRSEHNRDRPVTQRVLPAALLLKATALAVREVDGFNGFWDQGYQPQAQVRLGVAVSLRGGGLVAPAIVDADERDLDQLMADLQDLVRRARTGRLRSADVADPTVTVTNLGDQGAEEVFGVISAPQVALVGFGRIVERPWADHGMVGIRPVVRASLAADHRVTDGREGSRLLAAIDRLLQHPEDL